MRAALLPPRFDNDYSGHGLALWLLGVLLFVKTAIGVNSILNGSVVARSADGIPLDAYTPDGARAVVSLFALLGLWQLVLCLLGVLALVRYRAMTPLVFALFLLQHLGGRLISRTMPIARTGSPPGPFVNLATLVVMVLGLVLSLWRRRGLRVPASGQ